MTHKMKKLASAFANAKKGATAIEYALIAALIAVAIIGGVTLVGGSLQSVFTTISTAVTNAVSG